jgi:hypothetical protein
LMLLARTPAFAQAAPRTLMCADAAETGTPNRRHVVPVKIRAELSLGTVTATLDSLKLEEIPAFMTAKAKARKNRGDAAPYSR